MTDPKDTDNSGKDSDNDRNHNIHRFPDKRERTQRIRDKKQALKDLEKHQKKIQHEPILKLPDVTRILLYSIILIHIALLFVADDLKQMIIYQFSIVPARYNFSEVPLTWQALVTPLTHLFFHGSWLHLGLNSATLVAFGAGLEKALGPKRMLIFFTACGVLGAFAHIVVYFGSPAPMLGASGAISGLFAGLLLILKAKGAIPYRILPLILIWVGISVLFGIFGAPGVDSNIAWVTHLGGFFAGLLLLKPILRLKP